MSETSNINVQIPKELHAKCKVRAAQMEVSMRNFVNLALWSAVDNNANSLTKQPRKKK